MDPGVRQSGLQTGQSPGPARPQHSGHFPLSRLLQLVVLLQTERCPNARRLAEICEVSRRTIYRDLATLADAGITVVYRPDRQGYELARSLFLQPIRIEDREAAALLVLCGHRDDGDDLGLGELAARALGKLIQGLPEASRRRLLNASEVLSSPAERSRPPEDRRAVHEAILEAITLRRQVRLWVAEAGAEYPEATKFAIYRLARLGGGWSLVGRSSLHCRVLTLPLGRIARAELTADEALIPPRFDLQRYVAIQRSWPEQGTPPIPGGGPAANGSVGG
ncbi:MAG: HTH domain-containing protein [Isosphaeraceae bacterium]